MSKVSALAKLIRAMSGRPKFLRLHTAGGEFVLVADPNLSTRGSQDAIERWLRKRVSRSRIAQQRIQSFVGFVRALEGDKLDPAIRKVARQLALGRMVALRLDKGLPVLDGPHMVDLADLAEDPVEAKPLPKPTPAAEPLPPQSTPAAVPSPSPPPNDVSRPLDLRIEVVDDAGQPIPNAAFTLRVNSEAVLDAEVDDTGNAQLREVAPGSHSIDLSSLVVPTATPATDESP